MSLLKKLRSCGLTLVLLLLFLGSFLGQALAGRRHHNELAREHGRPPESLGAYLSSAAFWEATFENWESEFLQMAIFIVLTVFLYQRGSSESKPLPEEHAGGKTVPGPAPWPLRRGGWVLRLYEHSLSLALGLLFVISFALHGACGRAAFNQDRAAHGDPPLTLAEYFTGSRFWFESFQNWQSEFLSIAAIVVLSIFLREKDSAQSKPVAAPHRRTGG